MNNFCFPDRLSDLPVALVVLTAEPLRVLAYARALPLLLSLRLPVFINDVILDALEESPGFEANQITIEFIRQNFSSIQIISTGVVHIADQLEALGVSPLDESIRRIINRYEDESTKEYALLLSGDERFMSTSGTHDRTCVITTRNFLAALQAQNIIEDVDSLIALAKANAILKGDLLDPVV